MADRLESALVIALRDTIKWESSLVAPESGTLVPVDPNLPFDARTYQERDRQLAYRDLIVAAAVVEVSIQVGDVWNYSTVKPTLQGPAPFALSFVGTEAGTFSSQVRHVLNTSIPYDAARYADTDLYGRDSLAYEILARACQDTFVDPSIPRIDSTGTVIRDTPVWSLAQGTEARADINTTLALDRDLFKRPDQNLAERDNQIAGYVAQLSQVLRNPFEHALRLLIQVESYGTLQREPEVYALVTDDGTQRVFQGEPAVPGGNQIIYNSQHSTIQWVRETVDEVHVPQIYAMVIAGIEVGQFIETVAEVPNLKDPQYWSNKASQLQPFGTRLVDSDIVMDFTASDQVDGGVMQYGSASFTVPDRMEISVSGSLPPGDCRVSILAKPNSRVEIAGAQNRSDTSGTLGGATFDIDVASGGILEKTYLVQGGDGIVYNGTNFLPGDTFDGTNIATTYTQIGAIDSAVRQYAVAFSLALPAGAWNATVEYTNMSGSTTGFRIKGQYVPAGSDPVDVLQDVAPVPFTTANGNIVTTVPAGMDVNSNGPFSFPIYWTGGDGQLHLRKLVFTKLDTPTGYFAIDGTLAAGTASVANHGLDGVVDVLRWEFTTAQAISGIVPVVLNYTADSTLPLQIQQVQVQHITAYDSTPLSQGFQGWRHECLSRAERVIQQGFNMAVNAYGTDLPSVVIDGSYWNQDSTDAWMAIAELYNPRLREIPDIAKDCIAVGRQYQVDTIYVSYGGTTYTEGQRFYGVESAGSVYTGGTVHQVGAFVKSRAGHIGKPALVPRGTYFDDATKVVRAFYDTGSAVPTVQTCQPWMIEQGLYVAHENFWMPELL